MSSTHLSLHYHIIFSTKDRIASINDEWRNRLHAFIGGSIKALSGVPEAIGGTLSECGSFVESLSRRFASG